LKDVFCHIPTFLAWFTGYRHGKNLLKCGEFAGDWIQSQSPQAKTAVKSLSCAGDTPLMKQSNWKGMMFFGAFCPFSCFSS